MLQIENLLESQLHLQGLAWSQIQLIHSEQCWKGHRDVTDTALSSSPLVLFEARADLCFHLKILINNTSALTAANQKAQSSCVWRSLAHPVPSPVVS